jgi:hypothetical protein
LQPPPDVWRPPAFTRGALYIVEGEDSFGCPKLSCIRGTSALEGFHHWLRKVVPAAAAAAAAAAVALPERKLCGLE